MRFFITILLTGLSFLSFSQNFNKNVLLISTWFYNSKCEHVAFWVTEVKVEIYHCYNLKAFNFKLFKTIDLRKEPVIKTIFEKSTKELLDYEKEINATHCDYITPIIIFVEENGERTKIEWKGVNNCYPESMRVIVQGLEKVFEKYKE